MFYFSKLLQLLLLVWTFHANFAHGNAGVGYVDVIHYSKITQTLTVSGWVASEKSNTFITNIAIKADGSQIYRGRMLRADRPDVLESTGREDWLGSGFKIEFQISKSILNTSKKITASAILGNGEEIEITIPPEINIVTFSGAPPPSTLHKYAALIAILGPWGMLLLRATHINYLTNITKFKFINEKLIFGMALLLSFVVLVAAGLTGSSISLLFESSKIATDDGKPWLGQGREIRTDEWEVITPMAISQKSHAPNFPVVNKNWGGDGHNMLVVGMTGVPIAHISAVAKPATWGFFFLDLRSALAWYWWFPFFGCLIALWQVLTNFLALNWKLAAGLATSFAFSAYSVGFSGWPAYLCFFPLVGMLCMRQILKNPEFTKISGGSAILLGASISGFALILYPAWQISVAYLLTPFFLAWCFSQREHLHFRKPQWFSIFLALLTILVILGYWWADASGAVQAIQKTIYPGGRTAEIGGDIDPWFPIKGLLSIQTMYRPSTLMDASDAGSFIFAPFALIVSFFYALTKNSQSNSMGIVAIFYIVATTMYLYFGINSTIAHWTLLGMVTSYRMDLALGLAQIILMSWIFSKENTPSVQRKTLGAAASILTIIFGFHFYEMLPFIISDGLIPPLQWLSLLAWGALAFLIINRHDLSAVALFCIWTLITSLPFNPLAQAPKKITLESSLAQALKTAQENQPGSKISIIDERTWSLILPTTGQRVVNSVFYYPPLEFWKKIDPEGRHISIYNRYQRVLFKLQPNTLERHFDIQSPRLDEVILFMDPLKFNFNNLGSEILLSPKIHKENLLKNSSLRFMNENDNWILMKIGK